MPTFSRDGDPPALGSSSRVSAVAENPAACGAKADAAAATVSAACGAQADAAAASVLRDFKEALLSVLQDHENCLKMVTRQTNNL